MATRAGFAVSATDYYEDALLFTSLNVARNGGPEPRARMLDWRVIPGDLGRFDVIVASDVLYEQQYPSLIADVLASALISHGIAVIADPGRVAAPQLPAECAARGLAVRDRARVAFADGDIRQTIDLITIAWNHPSGYVASRGGPTERDAAAPE